MLELYQFEFSAYCEKVRFVLDYKNLPYRKVEVTPGAGQLEVFRLSGQRQVPVLKDGVQVIADSTAILKYLESHYPDRPLLPTTPKERGLTLAMEAWADTSIGPNGRTALLLALQNDPDYRTALLPEGTPDFLKSVLSAIPGEAISLLSVGVGATPDVVAKAKEAIEQDLDALCAILSTQPYLTGTEPTLADFAVAAMSHYIKVPDGPYLDVPVGLRGRGIPGVVDNPAFAAFFDWRDRLYQEFRKPLSGGSAGSSGAASDGPTTINID